MKKKGVILLITLFFIISISILILKNLSDTNSYLTEQNSKFALFRNYDVAKTSLTSVATLATKAVEETAAKKEALKAEVTQNVTDLTALIAADKELLAKAPKGKEGKAAVEAIATEIGVVETALTEVSTGLANGDDILTLSEKVKPAIEKANAINAELTEVIAKAKG